MDEFNIIDALYTIISASTEMIVYKDRSKNGETENHVVINHLQLNEDDFTNIVPVNINIFVKNADNGMPDRTTMKLAKRAIRSTIEAIPKTIGGQHFGHEVQFSARIPEAKEGFDCINIRVLISTDK